MNLTGKHIHVQSLQNNKQLLTVFTWSRSGYVINPLQCSSGIEHLEETLT